MSEFRRQHPVAAISRALGLIRGNLITILVLLFVGSQSGGLSLVAWIGGGAAAVIITGVANWWRLHLTVEDGRLDIKSGVFVRRNLYLTRDRIQVIDVTAGVVQRLFGLVRLDIQTAGSGSRAAAIEAITKEEAREINRLLRLDESDTEMEDPEHLFSDSEKKSEHTRFILPRKELVIAASTSGRFGIALSFLGAIFSQAEPILSEMDFYERIIEYLPAQTDFMMIIMIIVIFIIFAWLLSFFGTVFMYGNFMLEVRERELVVSRGIFERKRVTIPYNRIQAFHVTDGLIRQPLGYASLHLESAGYGDDEGTGSIVLFPLIKKKEIESMVEKILPEYRAETVGIRPPRRALRRFIFRESVLILMISAGLFFFLNLDLWIWALPVFAILWGSLKYRDTALGWDGDRILLRSRAISRTTAILRQKRIQDISLSQSPFQRFRDLCTVTVHVASGDHGKSFAVRDLELKDGHIFLKKMSKKGIKVSLNGHHDHSKSYVQLPGWG